MTDTHDSIREYWDRDASFYDRSASHAVSDPLEAAAWRAVMTQVLPEPPASILDVGAGTGSLTLLAAELGHRVTALDLSEGMLSKAREKAAARGLDVGFVVGSAMAPPAGPFDVVMERHVLWTMLDPVAALRAWRDVTAQGGRLVLFEGVWHEQGVVAVLKDSAATVTRRVMGVPDHHHAPYPDDVLAKLPLAGAGSPLPYIGAAEAGGWSRIRIHRLRDIEWAARSHEPWPLRWLEHRLKYALVADRG